MNRDDVYVLEMTLLEKSRDLERRMVDCQTATDLALRTIDAAWLQKTRELQDQWTKERAAALAISQREMADLRSERVEIMAETVREWMERE